MSLLNAAELVLRPISVAPADLVYVRHILEAHEGLGVVVGQKGGDVLLVTCEALAHELDWFIARMKEEVMLSTDMTPAHLEVIDALQ